MTYDTEPARNPRASRSGRSGPSPWTLVAVALILLAVAIVLFVLVSGRDPGTAGLSPTPAPTTSSTAGTSPAAPTPTGTSTATASPAATGDAPSAAIATDTIVETTVDGLSLRSEPGLAGDRLGTLAIGARSFVVEGPTEADGFDWYRVSGLGLPPNSGCVTPLVTTPFECPVWFGWAAAASDADEPWLVPTEPDCPATPVTAEDLIVGRSNIQRLACFGSESFTFRGFLPEIPDSGLGGACAADQHASGWLLCQNINYSSVVVDESQGFGGVGVAISVDPATDVTVPEGTWAELRVHLDDPAAQACDEAAESIDAPDREPEQYVLDCRAQLVVESITPMDGP